MLNRLFTVAGPLIVILAIIACSDPLVVTPSAPNPTLTTPQPTAQLVATVASNTIDTTEIITYPSPTDVPLPTDTPEPTPTIEPTSPPRPTNTPEPTAVPIPTNTPEPTAVPIPTNTPEPTAVPIPTNTPEPTAVPIPTNTPEPTPTPTPLPVLGSRTNPVPLGTVVEILEGGASYWAFVVSDTQPNANEAVRAIHRSMGTSISYPPEPGNQYYMVFLEAKYLGPESTTFGGNYTLSVVGQSAVVFTESRNGCGRITYYSSTTSDLLLLPVPVELFTGGAIKGWYCWEIPTADADSLQLLLNERSGDTRIWFALR